MLEPGGGGVNLSRGLVLAVLRVLWASDRAKTPSRASRVRPAASTCTADGEIGSFLLVIALDTRRIREYSVNLRVGDIW